MNKSKSGKKILLFIIPLNFDFFQLELQNVGFLSSKFHIVNKNRKF